MRVFLLDNYDSFTYNVVQLLGRIGAEVTVARNDAITVDEVAALNADAIVISPGPSRPENAGISVELVRRLGPSVPMLGICLGHQAIGVAYGAEVIRVPPVHGKARPVLHGAIGSFAGLTSPFDAGRYHSLAVSSTGLPDELEVTAWSEDGVIMGMRHRTHPVEGFQFHPESILTADGERLVAAFLRGAVTAPA
jgi:anthranilate synthase component II